MTTSNTRPIVFTKFCSDILGLKLETGQRVVAKVLYDGVNPGDLLGEEAVRAERMFGPITEIPPITRRTAVTLFGRASGKSSIFSAARLLHLGLTVDLKQLAFLEKGYGLVVAPSVKLGQQTLQFVRGYILGTASLRGLLQEEDSESITLKRPDGRLIEFRVEAASAKGSEMRGKSIFGAVMDEAAIFRDKDFKVNDSDIYEAIEPRLVPGGQIIIASTPWTEVGLLWQLFSQNFGKPTTAVAARAPTLEMRDDPTVRQMAELARMRNPENARREIDAQFLSSDDQQFFPSDVINKCIDETMDPEQPLTPIPGIGVLAGGDLAFISDSSALAIIHVHDTVMKLAEVMELRPEPGKPLKPSFVFGKFVERLSHHGATTVMADAHYREAISEFLRDNDINFRLAPIQPADSFIRARALMREGRVKFPKNERLVNQLKEVRSKRNPGGSISIQLPRRKEGHHCDLVSAFVLALYQAGGGEEYAEHNTLKTVPGSPEWFAKVHKLQVEKADRHFEESGKPKRAQDGYAKFWDER